MEDFIQILMKNLEKNQFPNRKVAFDLETLYEKAEDKKLSLNNVLDELKTRGVDHVKKGDRIIFKAVPKASANPFGPGFAETMAGMNPDFLAQAQEMMMTSALWCELPVASNASTGMSEHLVLVMYCGIVCAQLRRQDPMLKLRTQTRVILASLSQ